MDLCIHDVDYVCWLLGLPRRVSCEIVHKDQVTLHGLLTMAYEGCCAEVVGSWGMPEGFHGGELEAVLEIVGDDGMIVYRGCVQGRAAPARSDHLSVEGTMEVLWAARQAWETKETVALEPQGSVDGTG